MSDASSRAGSRRRDVAVALVFVGLTVALVTAMAASPAFFAWAFARHHNVLSWYVRPLFLIPYCVFAFRRSLGGLASTIFLLATSMFWFPPPAHPDPGVAKFLQVEMDYLIGPWTAWKVAGTVLVPLTLAALAGALWRRNLPWGLAVLVLIAVMKMAWSVVEAGEAGIAVFTPALVGLAICVALLWWGLGRPRGQRSR